MSDAEFQDRIFLYLPAGVVREMTQNGCVPEGFVFCYDSL